MPTSLEREHLITELAVFYGTTEQRWRSFTYSVIEAAWLVARRMWS